MRKAYRVLAYLIAAEVAVQAMAMVYGIAGLDKWISDGGVFDMATRQNDDSAFPEAVGFMIHGINGSLIIPVLALALLVLSFFAKVPNGVRWAGLVLLLVVIQINLGFAGPGVPLLGALHGLNALALFAVAFHTARRARVVEPGSVEQSASRISSAA
jgi:heme A synthase